MASRNKFHEPLLHFLLVNEQRCVYLKNVKKVLLLNDLKTIPNNAFFVVGYMKDEDKNIMIIDLSLRTNSTHNESYTSETAVLFCENKGKHLGFIIDKVLDLDNSSDKIKLYNDINKVEPYYLGSTTYESKPSLLIDLDYFTNITLPLPRSLQAQQNH